MSNGGLNNAPRHPHFPRMLVATASQAVLWHTAAWPAHPPTTAQMGPNSQTMCHRAGGQNTSFTAWQHALTQQAATHTGCGTAQLQQASKRMGKE